MTLDAATELQTEGNTKDTMSGAAVLDEVVKKKKKRNESEKGAATDQPDTAEKEVDNFKKKSEELSDVNDLIESAKVKGKTKTKRVLIFLMKVNELSLLQIQLLMKITS